MYFTAGEGIRLTRMTNGQCLAPWSASVSFLLSLIWRLLTLV